MNTSGRFQNQGSRPYVNGNREQTNNFLLDGVDVNDSIDNRIGYQPNVDALEEVQVLTGNAPAEFGNAAGAVVNAQMRSGTNQFHGNVFEFLRNDKLDANGFFNNRAGAAKRAFRRNIFGGTFGGPVKQQRRSSSWITRARARWIADPRGRPWRFAAYRTGNLSRFPQQIKDPADGPGLPRQHHSRQPHHESGRQGAVRRSEALSAAEHAGHRHAGGDQQLSSAARRIR